MDVTMIQVYGNTNELIAYLWTRKGHWYTASEERIDNEPEIAQLKELAESGFTSFVTFRCKGYENVYVAAVLTEIVV